MSGCGSLKVCGWLAGASVRAARCGLVQSGRAACAQPVPRMRSSTESYPARHRPRRDDLSVCLSVTRGARGRGARGAGAGRAFVKSKK